MKTRHGSFLWAGLAVVLLAFTVPTQAGLVSAPTAVTLSANGAEILNTGTLVSAWSANAGAGDTATVNGVTFAVTQPSNIAITGFTYSASNQPTTAAAYSGTEMPKLMGDLLGSSINAVASVTINSLTIGTQYRVQFLHHEAEGGTARGMWVRFAPSVTITPVFQAGSNGGGYISTFLFTADATSQQFVFHTTTSRRSVLNAMTVFDMTPSIVPSPAAMPAGLGLLAFGLIRRRR